MKKSGTSLFFSMLICLTIASCGGQSEKVGKEKTSEKIDLPQSYEGSPTIQAYLFLKDALVESDQKKASLNAKKLVASLDNRDEPEVDEIRKNASAILASNDLENQRKAFKQLSDSFYKFAKNKDMGVKLYRQYCPMAFQNDGAFWLSAQEEINNPYFGKKMLHCGVVREEI